MPSLVVSNFKLGVAVAIIAIANIMAGTRLLTVSVALAFAALSASTAIAVGFWRRKVRDLEEKIGELEVSLKVSLQKCAAERLGRIRTQQALRKAVSKSNFDDFGSTSYPMAPIGITRSCFSARNGTPRQPLIVPLARACLVFDPSRVPPASLEGLEGYSHCWIVYVFHLNTDLEKLWKHPSQSKFKAKVRVPRLKGEKMGVFATRSPHRPCPIGLTVAKVEAVDGNRVLLSGVDLVDGTPVLDVKPYLPYCDSISRAMVPDWVKVDNMLAVASVNFSRDFSACLNDCWSRMEKKSLYTSPNEFQDLIQQVLSWDIRSVSQRTRPLNLLSKTENSNISNDTQSSNYQDYATLEDGTQEALHIHDIVYHLILEGLDISYKIDYEGNVYVEKVDLAFQTEENHEITAIS